MVEAWLKTNIEIMESWLYVHCGILRILGYDPEVGHSEVCDIIAFIITLLLHPFSFVTELWFGAAI